MKIWIFRVGFLTLCAAFAGQAIAGGNDLRGTADLGIIVERAEGTVQIIDTTALESLARVEGLGDLSHASAVYSRDGRYAFIFGRDGGLTKIDLLTASITKRNMQAGNSIGGAISQDGKLREMRMTVYKCILTNHFIRSVVFLQ